MKPEDIPAGVVVLLDSPALIYLIDKDPTYYRKATTLFDHAEAGELTATTLVLAERLVSYYRSGNTAKANAISATLQS